MMNDFRMFFFKYSIAFLILHFSKESFFSEESLPTKLIDGSFQLKLQFDFGLDHCTVPADFSKSLIIFLTIKSKRTL